MLCNIELINFSWILNHNVTENDAIMIRFKTIVLSVIGDPDLIESERYFMTITCLITSVFLMGLCVIHLIMNLKVVPVFIAGSSSLVILGFYYLARFRNCLFIPKLSLTLWGLIMLDIAWYSKYLSNGPVLYFILIFGALILWVWEGKALVILLALYLINIVALFIIDYTAPDFLFRYPDNKTRSVDIYLSFFLYSSLMIFLLYIVKKEFIRQKEKAVMSDKLKSAFLANMSHEIRTPMNAIVGFSQLLGNSTNPENRQQYISIIKNSSNNLLQLINDILDLSKIEADVIEIKYSDFSIKELFIELKDFYTLELVKKDKTEVKLDYILPSGDIIVNSDALRLKQVLSNLLDNAIKFTSRGIISFSCEIKGRELIFSVSDTGTGISGEDQKKIFELFTKYDFQGMNTAGSGIGLFIVEKIIKLLNGRIWLKSVSGEGSSFFFSLPMITPTVILNWAFKA